MDIRPIRTEEDYQAALREVSAYFDNEPAPGTTDGDRFEILLTLVEAYEAKHYPIDLPDPVEAEPEEVAIRTRRGIVRGRGQGGVRRATPAMIDLSIKSAA